MNKLVLELVVGVVKRVTHEGVEYMDSVKSFRVSIATRPWLSGTV